MTRDQEARLDRLIAKYDELIAEQRKRTDTHRIELNAERGPYRTLTNARPPAGGFKPPMERGA